MKSKILVVEDNKDLLFNLELLLNSNNFEPILAKNGKEALDKLSKLDQIPDLIISDILMPKMNGYEFFKEILNNPLWNRIPFIFLTARGSPKEIRLGKLLGADDYITKPFNEKDLLASITGRLKRTKKIVSLEQELSILPRFKAKPSDIQKDKDLIIILLVFWDDKFGPCLKDFYPQKERFQISLNELSSQLYSAATSIYGQHKISKAEDALIRVANFNVNAYLFFDSYPKSDERFGEKQFMLAVLAPNISYFNSFEIKQELMQLSETVKRKEYVDLKAYWRSISNILINPIDLI